MAQAGFPGLKGSRKGKDGPKRFNKFKKSETKQKIESLDKEVMLYEARDDVKHFSDLPLSQQTKKGLKKAFFAEMTDIQAKSIPISLKGHDVLGAAQTGSGKTLAFLIPILEILYRHKWGPTDGLGAVVISPTRELAVQIFDVLHSIGGYHTFSAGLVIGGKNLKDESDRISRMNILIATPGRLLQHLDQTVGFDTDNLQMLVLDEADRILDMGFSRTLSALLGHLPKSRQTLLFSATQTQSVNDLARLSLKDPVYIGIQEAGLSFTVTPENLEQYYAVCDLDTKLDTLWSFIKSHLQAKIIVFMSSCKQVRFVFETFCKLHPGIPLLHLHGKQKQSARLNMFSKFTTSKHAVLFATDIAARGLDFPAVDWVVQLDAPEDAETYIHRVGRTARYESRGKALLLLMPSEEEGMMTALETKAINIPKIKIRASKTQSIQNQLQKLCFQDPEIKYLGQRAFVSYLRSVHLHKDKSVFKLTQLPAERFAESLGLHGIPKIKFLKRELAKENILVQQSVTDGNGHPGTRLRNTPKDDLKAGVSEDGGSCSDGSSEDEEPTVPASAKISKTGVRTKYDRMFERKNQSVLSEHYNKLIDHDSDNNTEDDFITLKRADHDLDESVHQAGGNDSSKRKLKMGKAKRTILTGGLPQKFVFDDEGKPHQMYELEDGDQWFKEKGGLDGIQEEGQKFAQGERTKMKDADVIDKQEAREKKREKKRKRKEKEHVMAASQNDHGIELDVVPENDDGYMSPEFDLTSEQETAISPPHKRLKQADGTAPTYKAPRYTSLEVDEELALKLLRTR